MSCSRCSSRRARWPPTISTLSRAEVPIPKISVVIPVYNEEAVLPSLFDRLYPSLDALGMTYEIVFVNDGSKDHSAALLREQFQRREDVTRVVLFHANFGQHSAV